MCRITGTTRQPAIVSQRMRDADYYREQAERARRLSRLINHRQVEAQLYQMAQDYDDIAEDLEVGAIDIRHPELMPQGRR
jgi:hypothetical protein